mmetsp:Transcript_34855/g.80606  ORF Transcript_34855/g.80606 Transcript_34855/m.80606 type:complete len:124 (-) Transcript_34855:53-424(-)
MKTEDKNYAEYEQWANLMLTTTVSSVLLTAPLGRYLIQLLGPICLRSPPKTPDSDRDRTNSFFFNLSLWRSKSESFNVSQISMSMSDVGSIIFEEDEFESTFCKDIDDAKGTIVEEDNATDEC